MYKKEVNSTESTLLDFPEIRLGLLFGTNLEISRGLSSLFIFKLLSEIVAVFFFSFLEFLTLDFFRIPGLRPIFSLGSYRTSFMVVLLAFCPNIFSLDFFQYSSRDRNKSFPQDITQTFSRIFSWSFSRDFS